MDSAQVDAYLRRLKVAHPARPTIGALRELHLRHLQTVPFENLSIHLGEEIVLEEKRLLDKVLGTGRGGFCHELNGAFAALLTALGFDVTAGGPAVLVAEGEDTGVRLVGVALHLHEVFESVCHVPGSYVQGVPPRLPG